MVLHNARCLSANDYFLTILFFSHGGKKHTRHVIHTNLMCALCISQLIFVFGIEATENRVSKEAPTYV